MLVFLPKIALIIAAKALIINAKTELLLIKVVWPKMYSIIAQANAKIVTTVDEIATLPAMKSAIALKIEDSAPTVGLTSSQNTDNVQVTKSNINKIIFFIYLKKN